METMIKMLKKTKLNYEDRLNLNFIKLNNLEELENIGLVLETLNN